MGISNSLTIRWKYSDDTVKLCQVKSSENIIRHSAVKIQSHVFKSVLKFDRSFDIYIHGNKELIEKDGRKHYKIYYKEKK